VQSSFKFFFSRSKIRRSREETFGKIKIFSFFRFGMLWLQRLFTSSQSQVPTLVQHTFGVPPSKPPLKNSQEMPPKCFYLSDSNRRGARARKDQRNAKRAAKRAAEAAALREEVGDIEEDVAQYEHKGGQAGESIRLKRLKLNPVSDDAAQSAPQLPLPVASPPPQAPTPTPQPLPHLAAIHASLDRLSPHERRKLLAERTQRELKKGQLCISTGGCAKHALVRMQGNTELIGTESLLVDFTINMTSPDWA
jgi:hypothetical protein